MTIEVGVALAVFAALSGVFWKMYDLIQKAGDKGEQAQRDLAAHKLHVAESYITKAGMRETTEQIMEAISGVKAAVDGLTLRVDRVVENQSKPASRARQ